MFEIKKLELKYMVDLYRIEFKDTKPKKTIVYNEKMSNVKELLEKL